MEHGTSLVSLMIVVCIAFIVPVVLHRLKLRFIPLVIAEIIVGLVIGRSGFNLVAEDPFLELLSLFGFIYLMFLSGLEIDFGSFSQRAGAGGFNPVKAALLITGGVFAVSFVLSFGLTQLGLIEATFLYTLIISAVSLSVVVPVLKEKRLTETPLGQMILLVTVMLDFISVILLAFYISFRSHNVQDILLLLLFFVFAFLIYRLVRRFTSLRTSSLLKVSTVQIGTRATFALLLLFVALSETLGVEMILGAFLAGIIVSILGPSKGFVHRLESFGYGFLIPIFFVMVGVDMEVQSLLTEPGILTLIPLLLICFFLAKLVPALLLKRWFSWRESIGSGMLLSANLSLVIVATTVALRFGIIDEAQNGALILIAVISCFVSPIAFSKLFPKQGPKAMTIGIVGANHITLPVSRDLIREHYEVELFSAQPPEEARGEEKYSRFPLTVVPDLERTTLNNAGLFGKDVIVLGTADDEVNLRLARAAKEVGAKRVIARIESADRLEADAAEGVELLSSLYASRTLMKAVIEHPSAVKLITQHDDSIQEAELRNPAYDGTLLRNLPFLGDVLVMRIFRGDSFVVPHGNTELKLGDRLLVSGEVSQIASVKRELE